MGRVKTAQVKRVSNKLMEDKGSEFSKDFDTNKKKVSELLEVRSKKIRNVIAGHITRLSRDKKKK